MGFGDCVRLLGCVELNDEVMPPPCFLGFPALEAKDLEVEVFEW